MSATHTATTVAKMKVVKDDVKIFTLGNAFTQNKLRVKNVLKNEALNAKKKAAFKPAAGSKEETVEKILAEIDQKKHELDQMLRFFESQTKTDIEAAALQKRETKNLESNLRLIQIDRQMLGNIKIFGIKAVSHVALTAFYNNFCDRSEFDSDSDFDEGKEIADDERFFYQNGGF